MIKALEILQKSKTHFYTDAKIDEAIKELEGLEKPKSCEGVNICEVKWSRTINNKQDGFCCNNEKFTLDIDSYVFMPTVEEDFYCNKYEPKDTK